MPIYEYACTDCGATFELIQRMNAKKTGTPCLKCGSTSTARQISVFAKGSANAGAPLPPCAEGGKRPPMPCADHCTCMH